MSNQSETQINFTKDESDPLKEITEYFPLFKVKQIQNIENQFTTIQ